MLEVLLQIREGGVLWVIRFDGIRQLWGVDCDVHVGQGVSYHLIVHAHHH